MKAKSIEMVLLFDFYGNMLTDKQKEFFDLYYNHDLSLAEIAENEGITRQGVRDAIVRARNILVEFEENLACISDTETLMMLLTRFSHWRGHQENKCY